MSKHTGRVGIGLMGWSSHAKKSTRSRARRMAFESLEDRRLLTSAPTSIVFQPQSGQGTATLTSANNSSTSKELQFLVSGVTAGDTVRIYADSGTTAIGAGTVATGATTITVTTSGTATLSNGSHTFTAKQIDTSSNVSAASPGTTVQVFADLGLTSATAVSATVGQAFTYAVTTNAPTSVDTVTVTAGTTLPAGMTFDPTTNTFSWTPVASQVGATQTFSVTLSDTAGNNPTISIFAAVAATSGVSALAPPSNIAIGSPVLVPLNSANSGTPNFSVTTSDSHLTATLLPQTNPVLKIVTDQGEMDFQLLNNYTPNTVAHLRSLISSNTYATSATFYRIIQNFMDQAGIQSSTVASNTIPVELNSDLRFTSSGLLALANNGVDGNSTEFFITNPNDMSDGFLDFRYTVFGKLISGDNVRQAIAATPVTTNPSSGETSQPLTAPKILSMSIATAPGDAVVMLKALSGATGSYTVTVSDGLGGSTNFSVTVGTNSFDTPNPWVQPINGTDRINTPANTAYTFTPQGAAATAAGGVTPQVSVKMLLPVPSISSAYVDSSYVPVNGSFEIKVGSVTTGSIRFDSSNLAGTAANIQDALVAAGFSGTTVTAASTTGNAPTAFSFNVTFTSSASAITYVASTTAALPITFANSATAAATSQTLTFTSSSPVADTTNPDVTLTQNGASYTVTPASGYYGVQFLEVMGFTPISGTFQLQVGSGTGAITTAAITFDSTDLTTTAANMQSALRAAGFSGATVTVASTTIAPSFRFNVTFGNSQAAISYVAASTALPVAVANSVSASATYQQLTFTATGTSWDSTSGVNPAYRALVPIFVAPPAPQIASISVNGQAVSGSTFANNATTATAFSFHITGAIAGAKVSVYADGSTTPIATGTVAANSTSIVLTTDGTTKIAGGNRQFTVAQSIATAESTLYVDWTMGTGGLSPSTQFPIAASSAVSAASAATTLTIGLVVLAPPVSSVQVGVPYTYVVKTNAPSSDPVTVTPGTLPAGMQFDNATTFTWTPTSAQLNSSFPFSAQVSDSLGNAVTIGPVNISVIIGLAPTQIPVNTSKGGDVTVVLNGSKVLIYDNIARTVLGNAIFASTDSIEIVCPAGQANSVLVLVPSSASAPMPKQVFIQGTSGSTQNSVIVYGSTGANNYAVTSGRVSNNGLVTAFSAVQKLTLAGHNGDDYYRLDLSSVPTWIVDSGGCNTVDFSHDTAGVTVNLGLDRGQGQTIAPWNTTLMIYGVMNKLIGSQYSDVLTGGRAAVTLIRSGLGNDTIVGGSGDNVLKGGGGNDTIVGGLGKNLMIAGAGTCTMYAKGWENMVFGGSTNFDSNDQALIGLLNQGSYAMLGYTHRRALASSANNPALLSSMLSFQDSGAVDTVFGSSLHNWFVLGKYGVVRN
jgi:large repetitive protein